MKGEWYVQNTDNGNSYGTMECKQCKKALSGDYITRDVYVSVRGNEDDYIENLCRKCCPDHPKFLEQDKHVIEPSTEPTASAIIRDLLDTISWLGGDSYEMEAIQPSVNAAELYLENHSE